MSKAKWICFFTDILELYKFLKKCVIAAFCLFALYNINILKRARIQQIRLAANDLINTIFEISHHRGFVVYCYIN